jgi:GNAT superfamily N-acetyltransferase
MTRKANIRPLRRDDLSAAHALIGALDLFPPDLLPEMAEPALSGASADIWWFSDDGKGLAYAAPERMTEGTWNVLLLAVHPTVQRQGLGRAMVGAVEGELMRRSGRLLLVETSGASSFLGARRFYRSVGFVREGRIREFYQAGEDKVIYARSLRP